MVSSVEFLMQIFKKLLTIYIIMNYVKLFLELAAFFDDNLIFL